MDTAQHHTAWSRLRPFAALVARRFFDDRCFEAAGALSYTTVFALVPLTMASVGIMTAFPVFETWSAQASDYVFENFVPAAATVVRGYLSQFAANASNLTSAGVIGILVSALLMLSAVEETFNRIWRVPRRRNRLARFMVYWTVLTFGPILIAVGVGAVLQIAARLGDMPTTTGIRLWPTIITFGTTLLAYLIIPNASVRLRHAVAGAVLATLLFELAKRGFSNYVVNANYDKVFGALALLPILLVWIYVSWLVALLGASLAASLGAFRFDVEDGHWPLGLDVLALVRVLRVVRDATATGAPPDRKAIGAGLAGASAEQVDGAIERLLAVRAIERSSSGGYVPIVDPDRIALAALFPSHPPRSFDAAAPLPVADEPATARWLAAYRQDCDRALSTTLGELLRREKVDAPEQTST